MDGWVGFGLSWVRVEVEVEVGRRRRGWGGNECIFFFSESKNDPILPIVSTKERKKGSLRTA